MGGRFGKYGDLKRKAILAEKPERKRTSAKGPYPQAKK